MALWPYSKERELSLICTDISNLYHLESISKYKIERFHQQSAAALAFIRKYKVTFGLQVCCQKFQRANSEAVWH